MNGEAVPLRLNGKFAVVTSDDANPPQHELTPAEALDRYNCYVELATDGLAGVRISKRGNVTTIFRQYHPPVSIWFVAMDNHSP